LTVNFDSDDPDADFMEVAEVFSIVRTGRVDAPIEAWVLRAVEATRRRLPGRAGIRIEVGRAIAMTGLAPIRAAPRP
jgi:hypothetical protein